MSNAAAMTMRGHDGESMTVGSMADADIVEMAIVGGDLAKLSAQERTAYYVRTCESLGLNPMTRPFEYIVLNGKLTLYARRDCAEQLRKLHNVSVRILSRETLDDIYVVTAQARMPDGREDESTGVVSLSRLNGEALANAYMKAETKAKRRVTLSICGLGWLDENEVEGVATTPRQPAAPSMEQPCGDDRRASRPPAPPRPIPDYMAAAAGLPDALERAIGAAVDAGQRGDEQGYVDALEALRAWMRWKKIEQQPGASAVVQFREQVKLRLATWRRSQEARVPLPAADVPAT